jgi:hypothetical protein
MMFNKRNSNISQSFTKSIENEGNILEDQDSVKPIHQIPKSQIFENSRTSDVRNEKSFHKLEKTQASEDPGSDIDDPIVQVTRVQNKSPEIKMSIDLSKILAKREAEQRGKKLYVVSKSRSPMARQKSGDKMPKPSKSPSNLQ